MNTHTHIHRDCTPTSFFTPAGTSDARRCVAQCSNTTVCGTVAIPEEHLKVCRGGGRVGGREGRGGGWEEGRRRGGGSELEGGERGRELVNL